MTANELELFYSSKNFWVHLFFSRHYLDIEIGSQAITGCRNTSSCVHATVTWARPSFNETIDEANPFL